MYTDDNNGLFPERTRDKGRWIDVLYDYYYKDPKFRVCPVATKIAAPEGATNTLILGGDADTAWGIVAPSGGRPAGTWGSYGINGWVYVNAEPGGVLYGKPAAVLLEDAQRPRRRAGPAVPGLLVLVRLADDTATRPPPRYPRALVPATPTP
jgi:hypothetical protein